RRNGSQRPGRPLPNLTDQRQQRSMIAALQLVTRHLAFVRTVQRYQPALLAQFNRNENRATMPGGGRVYGRCLHLALRWFECGNPNLPERARSPPPWNLRRSNSLRPPRSDIATDIRIPVLEQMDDRVRVVL